MGNPLFGVDIAGLIKQHVAPGLLDVTVTRMIDGGREAGNLTGGKAKTPQAFTGIKGIWEDLPSTPPAGVTFELNDRIALADDVEPLKDEQETDEKLQFQVKLAWGAAWVLTIILLILWPLPMHYATGVFGEGGFATWVAVSRSGKFRLFSSFDAAGPAPPA